MGPGSTSGRIELSGGVEDVRESEKGQSLRKRRRKVVKREERRGQTGDCCLDDVLTSVSQVHGLEG